RAGRLDRMHTRLEAARAALDVTLVRRSSVVLELAASGFLDPATSVLLADAAHEARGGQGPDLADQELNQSNLSRALRAAFAQPGFQASLDDVDGAADLLAELEAAAHQVLVARKFYNTAVATTRDARRKPLVRLLRLAGHAPLPEFFEMDDSLAVADDDGAGADMQRLAG
ncbi:MAG TPA: hypothetical protein VKV33_04115, partial [Streptosporangiaceae bacterium]|nr:hypothetical protein [Streptosporangiaceae bacterium]